MLVKEYRIPLPVTVEEYRVAQLYMIAKKSREESKGAGSGVEIIVNEPYTDGPGGSGQYTHKIYHIGSHLPGWFKALLPKSALTVEEEAWNAYPYTKTRYTCPFVEKFFLEIETKYFDDSGERDNVFDLSNSEIRNRTVDLIDVVKDQLYGGDYKREEDPKVYVSEKTNRGPLNDNWIEECNSLIQDGDKDTAIMCAYKLCRVEFKYWGMQSKIEKFIHDTALRKTMLRAHRQAWAWQDEWFGLTMEDIRQIEKETQEALARKMNNNEEDQDGDDDDDDEDSGHQQRGGSLRTSASGISSQEVDLTAIDKDKDSAMGNHELSADLPKSRSSSPNRPLSNKPHDLNFGGGTTQPPSSHPPFNSEVTRLKEEVPGDGRRKLWSRSNSKSALHSPSGSSTKSFDVQLSNWRMGSIVRDSETSSDEEFYDAEDADFPSLSKWSSLEAVVNTDDDRGTPDSIDAADEEESIFSSAFIRKVQSEHAHHGRPSLMTNTTTTASTGSVDHSLPDSPTASPAHQTCSTSVLVLVVHAGCVLDPGLEQAAGKRSDVTTFKTAFDNVIKTHYPNMDKRVVIRLVNCPPICSEALAVLSSLSPYSFQSSPSAIDGVHHTYDSVPLGALSLFGISSAEYQENVSRVIATANLTYHEFLRSEEGTGFTGQIVMVGDSVGAILGYDSLCRTTQYSHYGSETSIAEMDNGNQVTPTPTPQHSPASGPCPTPNNQPVCPRTNPLISISDGSGNDECEDASINHKVRISAPNRIYRKSHSHPQDPDAAHHDPFSYSRLLAAPPPRRRSSCSSDQSTHHRLDFEVTDLFAFGSPLGTILAYRKMLFFDEKNTPPPRPMCGQVYNLFHPTDPSAARIEPLLHARFAHLPPVTVPKYQKYPLGDGQPIHLLEYVQTHSHVFLDSCLSCNPSTFCVGGGGIHGRRTSEASITSTMSGMIDNLPLATISAITQKWWGSKRIDYALYCPEALANFPTVSLPHLFHASYWESTDVVAFMLRQFLRIDSLVVSADGDREPSTFVPTQPREKWMKKRTSVKIKNVTANHRANDVIVKEGCPQVLTARFMYGPLDVVALTGENVDIHIMKDQRTGEWSVLGTETTDKSGRVTYTIPKDKAMGYGIFPVKMVVRGDHTSIDFFLAVVPPKTESVVFSIDGSFTASVSVTGRDPKVRAGAVDVVRHWQELGFLIIYITGRPDMQQQKVVAWLAQHNFPHGLVSFAEGISTDPLRHKADFLKNLKTNADMLFYAAYGSSKDIWVYSSIGIAADKIFTVGKVSKKQHNLATVLTEGYAAHLSDLKAAGGSRPAQGNARMIIPRGCFSLPGVGRGALRQRRSAKRTTSYPFSPGDAKNRNPSPNKPINKV